MVNDDRVEAKQTERVTGDEMTAWVRREYGGPSALQSSRVPIPELTADRLLVSVRAASVNALDWHLLTGEPRLVRLQFGMRRPKNPALGADFAGVVEAVGTDVSGFEPGDRVFGDVGVGAFAEYLRSRTSVLAKMPDGMSFEDAASLPVAGLTALQGLRDIGGMEEGDKVLINGASGGVGTFAVQIAKALGAEVTAVCSTRNVEAARALGADHVIDYTKEDFAETKERFDVMLDVSGLRSVRDCKRVLTEDGVYVAASGPKRKWLGPLPRIAAAWVLFLPGSKSMRVFTAESRSEDLTTLAAMVQSGEVKPAIERTLPFGQVQEALTSQGEFRARGKTVITI